MPQEKTIEIILDENDSSSELVTKGFKGGACKVAAKPFRDVLGTVDEEHETAEARQSSGTVQHQTIPTA